MTEGYRNKDEFHVRLDASGRPMCGLLVGRARDASLVCVAPDRLVNTRRHHAEVAHLFRDYVARSDWPVRSDDERNAVAFHQRRPSLGERWLTRVDYYNQ